MHRFLVSIRIAQLIERLSIDAQVSCKHQNKSVNSAAIYRCAGFLSCKHQNSLVDRATIYRCAGFFLVSIRIGQLIARLSIDAQVSFL